MRVGYIKKCNDANDSLNSRIIKLIPTKIQKTLPDKIHSRIIRFKRNPTHEKPLNRPGNSCGFDDSLRRSQLESDSCHSPLIVRRPNCEVPSKPIKPYLTCGLGRLQSFACNDQGKQRRSYNANPLKLCAMPPLEREKMKTFQVQCRRSVRKYRPSAELFKGGIKKTEQATQNLFTNPMIREYIEPNSETN